MGRSANIALAIALTIGVAQAASATTFAELTRFLERSELSLPEGASPDAVAVDALLRSIDPGYAFVEEGETPAPLTQTGAVSRVALEMWSARLGYIAPGRFDAAGMALLGAPLGALDRTRLDGLIVDLRGCAGGTIDDAVAVASHLVPQGADLASQTVCDQGRSSLQSRIWRAGGGAHAGIDYRCALLTDTMTSGGAEALVAMLQPFSPFLVVGAPTAGTLAVRDLLPYDKGLFLSISTADLHIGQHCFRPGDPVMPDLTVAATDRYRGTRPAKRGPLARVPSDEAINDQGLMGHVGDDAALGKAVDILLAMRALAAPVQWDAEPVAVPSVDRAAPVDAPETPPPAESPGSESFGSATGDSP